MAIRHLYVIAMVYFVSDNERSHAASLETNRSCACTASQCDFSQVCSPQLICTRENVALGKPANISSIYPDSGPACVAVNGNTGTTYIPATSGHTVNCIHTSVEDKQAWWQVNLGRAFTVTNITVYIRDGFPDRMDGVSITVDGQGCYTFPSGTTGSPGQKQIWCTTPRTGSLVKFSRNGLLNICEVQIWVCKDGFFGEDCTKSCRSNCRHDLICDNYYGSCLPGDACSCSFGCNFSQSCTPSGNCRKENIALGKPARMSSFYTSNEPSGPACIAVNGNTGTRYIPATQGQQSPNCIHTANGDQNAWWEVDLGRNYTITGITVYIHEDQPLRMDNVRITVDGKVCYSFPSGTTSTPPVKNVSCVTPVQGSAVRLSRNTSDYYLNFCEVQVWVCKPGLYGENCESHCNCKDNEICDNYHGSCPAGCSAGYYGFNCTQTCGRCKIDSICDSANGYCEEGCQTRWKEPVCNECSDGYYGVNCIQECGHCHASSACNPSSGQCMTGCSVGWREPMCNVCESGYFGPQCQTCGKCRDSQACNFTNGMCPNGCTDGYESPLCNETCRNKTYGHNCNQSCGHCKSNAQCDVVNGNCEECDSNFKPPFCTDCKSGYFGPQCQTCGKCRDSQPCNSTNGICPSGCADGYEPPLCNETCSNKTYGYNCNQSCGQCKSSTPCDFVNGHCEECETNFKPPLCSVCKPGFFGSNCNKTCGFCNNFRPCDRENGTCIDGCADGYEPPDCIEKCSCGTWGRECQNTCGACLGYACRHDNGTCEKGCFSGYEGEYCTVSLQQNFNQVQTEAIVGSVVGAGLFIGGAIVIAVIMWLRRSKLKGNKSLVPNSEDKTAQAHFMETHAMQNLNFHEDLYDKLESSDDATKNYAVLGEENQDDHDKPSTALDNNYEKLETQYQNATTDSKTYENLDKNTDI